VSKNHPFANSEELLARALKHIPLGTQTFSKSRTQYPHGVSPFYAIRAEGSRLWDADGNEFVDFVNALSAVTLGYRDPDVDSAVRAQMEDGALFTLPHPIEIEVAEKICDMVPCAEMVRFGKNGSDATSGAVRLARAFTGRDRIAVCGYHGWQDWFIGSTPRSLGVPQAVRDLTHTFVYNDIESLAALFRDHPGAFAGVIMEPMNVAAPEPGFLESVQALCREHGVVFILDEMITGFRFAKGGAQDLFGVTPDLATFGKGLANGYPLSAIAGRADIMALMEDVFFSFTMGGEALSLAAARATLNKISKEPVIERLDENGTLVANGLRQRIADHGVGHIFAVTGQPCWSFLNITGAGPYTDWDIRTYLLQEMFERRVLMLGTHTMSYAHGSDDIDRLLRAYDEILPAVRDAVAGETLDTELRCKPLEPLFRVR
jgi:glutamate-1-semialdehyde 2,1-aminomutase